MGEEGVRGKGGVLRGEEGFGKLVMIGEMRREGLGAGEGDIWLRGGGGGHEGGLEVRLRLCGEAWLVGGVQVAQVNRMRRPRLTQERVQGALLVGRRRAGGRVLGEDMRLMRKVGVGQERGKGRREHLREVLRWVLVHVDPSPCEVLCQVLLLLQIRTRPGVRIRAVSPRLRLRDGLRPCFGRRVAPAVGTSLCVCGGSARRRPVGRIFWMLQLGGGRQRRWRSLHCCRLGTGHRGRGKRQRRGGGRRHGVRGGEGCSCRRRGGRLGGRLRARWRTGGFLRQGGDIQSRGHCPAV